MNKPLIAERFTRGLETYDQEAIIQRQMAEELVNELKRLHPAPLQRVLEIGYGTGLLTARLLSAFSPATLFLNDLIAENRQIDRVLEEKRHAYGEVRFLQGDIESLAAPPDRLNLIISNSTLQWLEDLFVFFTRARAWLSADGLLAISVFGPRNLFEIRETLGLGLDYPAAETLRRFLERDFRPFYLKEDLLTRKFPDPAAVLRHFRHTGVGGLERRFLGKKELAEFSERYRERFTLEDGVSLTYHPLLFIGRKR